MKIYMTMHLVVKQAEREREREKYDIDVIFKAMWQFEMDVRG